MDYFQMIDNKPRSQMKRQHCGPYMSPVELHPLLYPLQWGYERKHPHLPIHFFSQCIVSSIVVSKSIAAPIFMKFFLWKGQPLRIHSCMYSFVLQFDNTQSKGFMDI